CRIGAGEGASQEALDRPDIGRAGHLVVSPRPRPDRQPDAAKDERGQETEDGQRHQQFDQGEAGWATKPNGGHGEGLSGPSRTVSSFTSRRCRLSVQPTETATPWPSSP